MATTKIVPVPLFRPLYIVGREIEEDFRRQGKPIYYAAAPYVEAMCELVSMTDSYYADDAETVVAYALSNLTTWRGETAKRVKAELKSALAWHKLTPAQRGALILGGKK